MHQYLAAITKFDTCASVHQVLPDISFIFPKLNAHTKRLIRENIKNSSEGHEYLKQHEMIKYNERSVFYVIINYSILFNDIYLLPETGLKLVQEKIHLDIPLI